MSLILAGEPVDALIDIGADEFLDNDHDRLPNLIESGTGIYLGDRDTGSCMDDTDSDDDGVSDFDEWYATTNPNRSNEYLRMTRMWHEKETNYVEWVGGVGVDQQLQWNSDLRTTNWSSVINYLHPTPMTNQWPVNGFASGAFRIQALR